MKYLISLLFVCNILNATANTAPSTPPQTKSHSHLMGEVSSSPRKIAKLKKFGSKVTHKNKSGALEKNLKIALIFGALALGFSIMGWFIGIAGAFAVVCFLVALIFLAIWVAENV